MRTEAVEADNSLGANFKPKAIDLKNPALKPYTLKLYNPMKFWLFGVYSFPTQPAPQLLNGAQVPTIKDHGVSIQGCSGGVGNPHSTPKEP